jgi:shikimate kinase
VIAPDQHVVLVGLMGVGKSTVARSLGQRLGRPVVDSDAVIESQTGRTVRQIFEAEGEEAFRTLETAALVDALASDVPLVIAAAGGVVLRAENREALRASGAKVVWLSADVDTLIVRVRGGQHRPALDGDPAGTLRRMHETREPLYREVADVIVSVDGRSVSDVIEAILR